MKNTNLFVACVTAWLVWAPGPPACAQDRDAITERFEAPQIKESIYLQIGEKVLTYKHDKDRKDWNNLGLSLRADQSPLWLAKSEPIMLYMGFYNPYKYAVTVSSDLAEDEINAATEQFGTQILTMLTGVSGVPLPTGIVPNTLGSLENFLNIRASLDDVETQEVAESFKSLSIIEWRMWVEQLKRDKSACLNPDIIKNILNTVQPVERFLYGEVEADTVLRMFSDHVRDIITMLTRETTYHGFKESLRQADERVTALEKQLTNGKKSLEALNGSSHPFNGAVHGCNVYVGFEAYHDAIMKQYYAESVKKIEDMNTVLQSLKAFRQIGVDFLKANGIENSTGALEGIIFKKELSADFDHINTVTVVVDEQKIDPDQPIITGQEKKFSVKFRLARFRTSWPELSTGLSYANVTYYSYSTGDATISGTTTSYKIVEKESKQHVLAALYYNQVFDIRAHNFFPFFQIGAGSTKDYPSLMFGAGARLVLKNSHRLSFSMGVVVPFVKTLKTLAPDGMVESQAAIDADIQYSVRKYSPYFGLAWKIN